MRFLHVLLLALMSTMSIHAFGQCNNVLTNGNASSGLTGWNFSSGTGTTWTVQNGTYGPAFVASYNWTTMNQTVDLWANGYSTSYLDNQQPEISYMQMYRGHTVNYADKYYYKIELRSATNQVIASYNLGSQTSPITTTSAWDTVAGSFTNYGSGVRYVRVECGGDDAEFWAGNYGTIVDNSVVSVANIINANICSGTYIFNGQVLSTSGQYNGNFTGQYGCDSNVILNLQVGPYNISDTFELCNGDTFYFDGSAYTSTSTLSGNFSSTAGCDSNVSYQVNFRDSYNDSINAGICPGEGYDFDGQMLFTPGSYSGAFTSQYGCDSLVALELVFNPVDFLQITDYLCPGGTYDFGGTPITAAGTYTGQFTNGYGCDSTVMLTLLQDQEYDIEEQVVLCEGESIFLGTQTITEAGTYSETFATSGGGCDSMVTLEVSVMDINTGVTIGETFLSSKDGQAGSTYQWLNCNQDMTVIAGATSQSYNPPLGGSYAVEVTNGACVDTSACKKFTPVGLEELNRTSLSVYPNPANDFIQVVAAEEVRITAVQLTDMQGRIVLQKGMVSPQGKFGLDISSVADGSYVLSIQSLDGDWFQQVLSVVR